MRLALPVLVVALLLLPAALVADKKADEEYKKINPPAPYTLWVGGDKHGSEKILKIFGPRNVGKKWRPFYDSWFKLVPGREDAEIQVEVREAGFDSKPGYETVFYINGSLTIRGVISNAPIRGDGTVGLWTGSDEEFDLMGRIVRFMRDSHKADVLAHTASAPIAAAAIAPPSTVPSAAAPPQAATQTSAVPPGPAPAAPAPAAPPAPTTALAADEEAHPLYGYWARFKPGSWVLRKDEGTLSGETKETLVSVSPGEVVIEVQRTTKTLGTRPPARETIPARRKLEKGTPWQESEETADISGKTLQCHVQRSAEMTRFYCPDVPGGFARFEWNKDGKLVQRTLASAWEAKP